jgi:hypothetical protein
MCLSFRHARSIGTHMLADVIGLADDCCNTALFKFVTLTKLSGYSIDIFMQFSGVGGPTAVDSNLTNTIRVSDT